MKSKHTKFLNTAWSGRDETENFLVIIFDEDFSYEPNGEDLCLGLLITEIDKEDVYIDKTYVSSLELDDFKRRIEDGEVRIEKL